MFITHWAICNSYIAEKLPMWLRQTFSDSRYILSHSSSSLLSLRLLFSACPHQKWVDCESSSLRSYLRFFRRQPLVAVVINAAAKEELRQNHIKSDKVCKEWMFEVKLHRNFLSFVCQRSTMSYFKWLSHVRNIALIRWVMYVHE